MKCPNCNHTFDPDSFELPSIDQSVQNVHFAQEEQLFMTSNYTEKEAHIVQHREFANEIENLIRNYSNQIISSNLIFGIVYGWFRNHIFGVDIKYVPYISVK